MDGGNPFERYRYSGHQPDILFYFCDVNVKVRKINTFKVSIVIPCFNEEGNLEELYRQLTAALPVHLNFEVILVNDGSSDNTLKVLEKLHIIDTRFHYLSFSRNFGHQMALKAGIDHSDGDCVINMDADLQHPPEVISTMIEKWIEGYDIVYTQREDSKDESFFKRKTSRIFYRIINFLANVNLEYGTADFRLLDKSVASVIRRTNEKDLFLRGYISWLGFRQEKVVYKPAKRFAGNTKYSFSKMLQFALKGITSFSVKPLHFSTLLGIVISAMSFLYSLYVLYIYFFTDQAVSGWSSMMITFLFIGGVQLIILGILGEYLGKLFIQSKGRPDYVIEDSSLNS